MASLKLLKWHRCFLVKDWYLSNVVRRHAMPTAHHRVFSKYLPRWQPMASRTRAAPPASSGCPATDVGDAKVALTAEEKRGSLPMRCWGRKGAHVFAREEDAALPERPEVHNRGGF
jgi:hypothetical protein